MLFPTQVLDQAQLLEPSSDCQQNLVKVYVLAISITCAYTYIATCAYSVCSLNYIHT